MQSPNRKRPSSEQGFALVTALMACAILFALAMLVLNLSTSDLKVSARNVGDKKADRR
jgi:Tfp pilus assembly protein PilX